ncbi:hypothetical protein [Streptacidiphilus albus]|uniref:hypothetical protein n=1 Tax=Streptacidiphilus albus TaxID=105425 RepID=UPI0005A88B7E|nr:hypothetical protein [Streptacidiphilus albus]
MAEVSTTKFDSVIAGIRGYLGEQLGELERELDEARQSLAELREQLAAKQSSIEVLVASRDLLATKLSELDGAMTGSAVVALPRQSRAETEQPTAPQAEVVAVAESPVETSAESPAETSADAVEEKSVTTAGKPNAGQRQVLDFLEATPGVHRVSEIATGVAGPDAGNAAAQAVRRALAALVQTGLATKSSQSGTAFYSATEAESPAPAAAAAAIAETAETSAPTATAESADTAEIAGSVESAESVEEVPAAPAPRRARTRKAAPVKANAKQTGPKKAAKRRPARATAATTAVAEEAGDEAPASTPRVRKTRTAKGRAAAEAPAAEVAAPTGAAEKSLRADRAKIVATLRAAADPQSAGEVSRTVMGDDWRASDATNFRQVLKSMTAEGLVAEHHGEKNRTRYTATTEPDVGAGAGRAGARASRGQSAPRS